MNTRQIDTEQVRKAIIVYLSTLFKCISNPSPKNYEKLDEASERHAFIIGPTNQTLNEEIVNWKDNSLLVVEVTNQWKETSRWEVDVMIKSKHIRTWMSYQYLLTWLYDKELTKLFKSAAKQYNIVLEY